MAKPKIKINNWFVATFGEDHLLTFHDPYLFNINIRDVCIVGDLVEGKLIASTDGTSLITASILAARDRRVAVFDAGLIEIWTLGTVNKKYRRWLCKEIPFWDYATPVITYHDDIFDYFDERSHEQNAAPLPVAGLHLGNDPSFG